MKKSLNLVMVAVLSMVAVVLSSCGVSNAAFNGGTAQGGTMHTADAANYSACNAINLGNGSMKFQVTLPSGQNYVEVFVRQNGIQNVAQNIQPSGVVNADGTTTYSYIANSYKTGDLIEYRFYSYIGPGVFTPGPAENAWVTNIYGQSGSVFSTSTGVYNTGEQTDANGAKINLQVYTNVATSYVTPAGSGWLLYRGDPGSIIVPLLKVSAEVVGIYVKRAGTTTYDPISSYISGEVFNSQVTATNTFYVYTYGDTGLAGTRMNETYAEGGTTVQINTYIGYQTLKTGGKVTYAFLVKHK